MTIAYLIGGLGGPEAFLVLVPALVLLALIVVAGVFVVRALSRGKSAPTREDERHQNQPL